MSVIPTLSANDRSAPPADDHLERCLQVYRRWLALESDDQVIAALGAVAANLIAGDPLWLLFVAVPGGGKTETIAPLATLEYIIPTATLTEASMLSGTAKKEKEDGATGGVLRQVGEFGILLCKDFSGVLAMHREARAATLAALREVFDGSWARPVGTGGGRILNWAGKCGFIGAVTPSIDRHHGVMGALGERFVLYRMASPDPRAQARQRLANRGQEKVMRAELAAAVTHVLDAVALDQPPRPLELHEVDRLIDLTTFVVRARTAVERDGYDREVVVMPTAEAPGRLIGALGSYLAGIESLGANLDTAWRIVEHAAWGCVPQMRKAILDHLHRVDREQRTSEISAATSIPKTTCERTLEDLALLNLVDQGRTSDGDTAAKTWTISQECAVNWPNASPETSDT